MKVFLDANILVSVLNKEYPKFPLTSRILSLADVHHYSICTSPVCLAIAFYFAEKKYKTAAAKQKVRLLCEHIEIADVSRSAVRSALSDPAVNDFEDGLEHYAAIEAHCDCIVTEDTGDFHFSKIEVLSRLGFYEKYMVRKK
jgi:predicted nucleic acid-binding protein